MSIFKQFAKSFYSPQTIATYRFQGIGKTILYIFFLTLVSSIPSAFFFSSGFYNTLSATSQIAETDLPDFKISDGKLLSSETEPIEINHDGFTLFFDSTGTLSSKEIEIKKDAIALLKNEVVLIANYEAQSYDYSMLQDFELSDDDLTSFIQTIQSLLPIIIPLALLVMYIFASGLKFIEITILAFIGLLIKNMSGRTIRYRHSWILATYSVTISTVFFTVMNALRINVPSAFLLNWFVSITVLTLTIKEIPRRKTLK